MDRLLQIKVEEGSYTLVNENKNKTICLLCDLYDVESDFLL